MDILRPASAIIGSSFAALAWTLAGSAVAAEPPANDIPRISLTPLGGYTFGGEFTDAAATTAVEVDDAPHYGLIFNLRESTHTQWEIFYARQESEADTSELPAGAVDLDVQYLHVGGTYVADGIRARPFLAATVGMTRFDPDPLTFDSENFFSFGIGAGYQFRPTDRLGVRLESRLLGTFLRSDTDLFCETGPDENLCAISSDSDTYWQLQASLGLVFRF
jgi:opacity protein-like surface antigen